MTAPRRAIPLLALLAVGLNAIYLVGGFHGDDFILLNMLREDPLPFSRLRGLWSTTEVPAFRAFWWGDPGYAGAFWRPLPSLVFEGSVRLFGEVAAPLHALSLALHALVAALLYLWVRAVSRRDALALFAGLLFVACEDHSMVIGWIATITDLFCVAAVMGALLAHRRWLERRSPGAMAGAVACLLVALASKESAAVAPLALVLQTVLAPGGRMDAAVDDLGASVRAAWRDGASWALPIAVLGGWLALYRGLSLGGMHNLMYVDPLGQPAAYLGHLVLHLPTFWMGTLSPAPPSLGMFMPESLPFTAGAGLLLFAGWVWALWPNRRDPLVLWAFALYLLALLPQAGTDASERGLYFPFIGAAILLGRLLADFGPIARRIAPEAPLPPRRRRLAGAYVLCGVLLPGVAASALMPPMFARSLARPERELVTALPVLSARRPDTVLVLNTAGMMTSFYVSAVWEHFLHERPDVRVLSSCNANVSLERLAGDRFVLRVDRRGWLTNPFARIVRTEWALDRERHYENDVFTASLLELTPDGRDALAVRFSLKRPLDDAGLLILTWDGEAFRPLDLAALRLHERHPLADTSDVWGSMS